MSESVDCKAVGHQGRHGKDECSMADQIIWYLNGDVTERQRKRIEVHLAHCLACQEDLKFWTAAKRVQKRADAGLDLNPAYDELGMFVGKNEVPA